ncbi:ABC transporter [Vandammella animalimorsus]|uniref:ABC transporter n=1 Tax=Vandammella animalimorsus TaxID=2029117 RepID=A0A2A2T2F7_9BURK|nr:ATP-binding cassette domain-containing protein [Vandammella animalimorsus]PAT30808.1 ABC transporter [Vandammella animalimorsus]PAX15620.1 ABC transporter [Vandammella animalimorsus]PAX17617.1 ABC transporter [Vandammella animalimorsus]
MQKSNETNTACGPSSTHGSGAAGSAAPRKPTTTDATDRVAPVLHIHQLHWAWPGAARPLLALRDWHLGPGLHLLRGAPGSGTSTLLRLLAGQLPLDGRSQISAPAQACGHWQALVHHWDPDLQQHDALPARALLPLPANAPPSQQRACAELIEGFALAPHLDKPLHMLSTGTRRKVLLSAALLSPRPVLLLDEPCAALDWRSIRVLWHALAVRSRLPGQLVLLGTHQPIEELPPWRWAGVHTLQAGRINNSVPPERGG